MENVAYFFELSKSFSDSINPIKKLNAPKYKKQPGVEHRIGSLVITRVYVLHAWLALHDSFSVSNLVSQRRNSFFFACIAFLPMNQKTT